MQLGPPRFRVLGPLEVAGPDGPLPLVGERKRALLAALLAARGATLPADALVELLWAGDPPRHPTAALHTQVSRLRQALAPVLDERCGVETRPPGYALATEPGAVDADRFEHLVAAGRDSPDPGAAVPPLEEALAMWRGPAYAGFADRSAAVQVEAIRLEELRLGACELLAAKLVAAGRPERALPLLEGFVREHPLREEARGTLIGRCTPPAARATPCASTRTTAATSPTSWASNRRWRCSAWRSRSSAMRSRRPMRRPATSPPPGPRRSTRCGWPTWPARTGTASPTPRSATAPLCSPSPPG